LGRLLQQRGRVCKIFDKAFYESLVWGALGFCLQN